MDLTGKGALVTGGGRGIGAACARALAKAGAKVVVTARTESEIKQVAKEIGGDFLTCDLTDSQALGTMSCKAAGILENVDIVINNAGYAASAALHKETLENWNRMFALNVTAVFLVTKMFTPNMVERGWGRVVNIASIASLHGAKYISAYTATKHAVLGFTRSVAAEMEGKGVTVNAVCPGYVNTPMTDENMKKIMERTGLSKEEAIKRVLESSNQKKMIEPEDVAKVVLGLCNQNAKNTNGQYFVMDGEGVVA